MTLLTTGNSHQNPLIRRVRRHSTLAMLFRAPLPAALPVQRDPETLLLGQPPRSFPQAPLANVSLGSELPLFPVEALADQLAAPIQDGVDLPTLTPAARTRSTATTSPIAAAPPAIAALSAPSVQRTMAMPPSEPTTSPLTGAVSAPISASVPSAPVLSVTNAVALATGSAPQTSPTRITAQSAPAPAVLPATQTIPPSTPTAATPSSTPVQRAAVEPATDTIDASTWRRLQAAYNRYREREATGDWPPSATTTSAATTSATVTAQPLFAGRRAAPLRPAPPAQAPPPVVQRYPEFAPVAQEQPSPPLDAASAMPRKSTATSAQSTAPATTAAQSVIQPAPVVPPNSTSPAPPTPVQNMLTSSPLASPPAAPMPADLAQQGMIHRSALLVAAPQTPAVTSPPASAPLSAEQPDNQQASVMASTPMALDHLAAATALLETAPVDTPPLEAVWPVHQVTTTMTGTPGMAPPMVQQQPAPPASLSPVATHVEAAPPLAPQVHERLTASQTARPTESKVDVVMPRRPRPPLPGAAQLSTTASVAQRTEATTHQPTAAQPTPVAPAAQPTPVAHPAPTPLPDFPLIETEIGPLPADLWTLVGVTPPHLTGATVAAPAPLPGVDADDIGEPAGLPTPLTPLALQLPGPERATPTPVVTGQTPLVAPTVAPAVRPDLPLVDTIQRTVALPDIIQTPAIAAVEAVFADKNGAASSLSLSAAQGDNRPPAGDEVAVTPRSSTGAWPAGAAAAVSLPSHRPLMTLQRQPEQADPVPPGEPVAPPAVDADEAAAKKKRRKPSTSMKSPARSTRRSVAN